MRLTRGFLRIWVVVSVLWIGWIAATEGPRDWEDFRCTYAPPPQRSLSAQEFEHGVGSEDGCPDYGPNLGAAIFRAVALDTAQHTLIPPLGLLAAGLTIIWIRRGFQGAPEASKKGPRAAAASTQASADLRDSK